MTKKNTSKLVLSIPTHPTQEMSENEIMYRDNLNHLIRVAQDVDRAGKMIGRYDLLLDLFHTVMLVVVSMTMPEMLSMIYESPKLAANSKK